MSINLLVDKQNVVLLQTKAWISHKHITLDKKTITKDYIWYDSICIKCPDKGNP